MNKVKEYLAAFKKHHFWVLTAIILIVGLSTWARASWDMQARFTENQSKIKATYTMLTALGPGSPNEKFSEGLKKEQVTLKSQVFDAWKDVVKKQRDITNWPKQVLDIGKLGPNEHIPEDLRQNYMNAALPTQWKEMFDAVKIRHPKGEAQVNLDDPSARRQAVEYEGIVVWDQEQRDELMKRYQVQEIPTDLRVRLTQEDMWVFQSMINLIVKLNEGAGDPLAAVVKRIDKLELAQWAIADAQKSPGAELKLKKADDQAEMAPIGGMGDEESFVPLPGSQDHTEDKWLLEGRYLDQNNQPISIEAALKNPPFAEFKQMFVNMQFVMDQRRIPDLLAACANSPLRIEPRQVIMHFSDIDHQAKVESGELAETTRHLERGPYDCVLQIRGIVYIYNEPEEPKLGTGSAPQPAQRGLGIPERKVEAPKAPVQEEQPLF